MANIKLAIKNFSPFKMDLAAAGLFYFDKQLSCVMQGSSKKQQQQGISLIELII